MLNDSLTETLAKVISTQTAMLSMIDMNDPSGRALEMASINFYVCVLFF